MRISHIRATLYVNFILEYYRSILIQKERSYIILKFFFDEYNFIINREFSDIIIHLIQLYRSINKDDKTMKVFLDIIRSLALDYQEAADKDPQYLKDFYHMYNQSVKILMDINDIPHSQLYRYCEIDKNVDNSLLTFIYKYDYYFIGVINYILEDNFNPLQYFEVSIDGSIKKKGRGDILNLLINLKMGSSLSIFSSILPGDYIVTEDKDNNILRFWNSKTNKCESMLKGYDKMLYKTTNMIGKIIIKSTDDTLVIWNFITGKCVSIIEDIGYLKSFVYVSDKLVVLGSESGVLTLRSPKSRTWKHFLRGHQDSITDLDILNDGKLISKSLKCICIWDLKKGKFNFGLRNDYEIQMMALPDKRFACLGDRALSIWNSETQKCEIFIGKYESLMEFKNVFINNLIIGISEDTKSLVLYNVQDGKEEFILQGHMEEITHFAITSDNKIMSSSKDDTLRIWNLEKRKCEFISRGHYGGISYFWNLLNGKIILKVDNGGLELWNLKTNEFYTTITNSDSVNSLYILSDNRVVTKNKNGTISVWK